MESSNLHAGAMSRQAVLKPSHWEYQYRQDIYSLNHDNYRLHNCIPLHYDNYIYAKGLGQSRK